MHVVKCGWVVQTFALAKRNESGGRKSRIRISKEERKKMVESFIKKYQSLNNGSFPSLNLTHKEVGGSFYTVREIVREIILENRVLGPAKLLPEEQNTDQLLEQYPLGTISTEPQPSFILQNGSPIVIDQHQKTIEEPGIVFDGLSTETEQESDNEQIVNGNRVAESEQSDKPEVAEVVVGELVETERSTKKVTSSKITKMADVIVETFPIRPVAMSTDYLDGNSGEARDFNGSLEEKEVDKSHIVRLGGSTSPDEISSSSSDNVMENPAVPLLETKSDFVVEKAGEIHTEPPAGSPISSAPNKHIMHDIEAGIDVEVKSSRNDKETAKTMIVNAQSSCQTATGNGANGNAANSKSIAREAEMKNEADFQRSDSCKKGSNPSLDRINLESWQGASKNSAEPESNPLWAIFKSFIATFVKFWSE